MMKPLSTKNMSTPTEPPWKSGEYHDSQCRASTAAIATPGSRPGGHAAVRPGSPVPMAPPDRARPRSLEEQRPGSSGKSSGKVRFTRCRSGQPGRGRRGPSRHETDKAPLTPGHPVPPPPWHVLAVSLAALAMPAAHHPGPHAARPSQHAPPCRPTRSSTLRRRRAPGVAGHAVQGRDRRRRQARRAGCAARARRPLHGQPGAVRRDRHRRRAGDRVRPDHGRPDQPRHPGDDVQTVATKLPAGAVESLEGSNEWDLSGRPDWVDRAADPPAAALRPPRRPTRRRPTLPVLSPALAFRWNYAAARDDLAPCVRLRERPHVPGWLPADQRGLPDHRRAAHRRA